MYEDVCEKSFKRMLSASLDFLPGCIHVIVGVLVKKHHI